MLDNGYVSVNTVIARIKQNPYIKEDFNKITTINLIGQALRLMSIKEVLEHTIELIDIYDFKGDIPNGLKQIIQTGYRIGNEYTLNNQCGDTSCEYTLQPISSDTNTYKITNVGDCANGNCNTIIIEKKFFERQSYMPSFNLMEGQDIKSKFKPIYPSANNFGLYVFNKTLSQNYSSDRTEAHAYVITDEFIETSFKHGQLLISFLRTPMDDDGYPLVPNDEFVLQCCEKYYYYKNIGWKVLSGIEPNLSNLYVKLEQEFNDSLVRVKGKAKMPNKEQLQMGHKNINTLLPNDNKFNNYFGYF